MGRVSRPKSHSFSELSDGYYNAWLRLKGPDMSPLPAETVESLDRAITWSKTNSIRYYGPERASFVFNPINGLVTGTYADGIKGVKLAFGGALLQKQGLVTGRYTANQQAGFFSISKRVLR